MSNDQALKFYSDDQWWDLQDDHHPHDDEQLLQQNYQIATPLDNNHAGRHNAKLFTSATRSPETANIQYDYHISSSTNATTATYVSPENLMKRPTKVLTSPAKPKRRRGTMAATTFLNSTISNFRELVQRHTGMSSTSTPPSSYYASCDQKGPITLCFTKYSSSSSTSESALGFINRNQ